MSNLEYPTLLINHLVDNGANESIETIKEKVQNGELFDYLADKYEDVEFKQFAVRKEAEKHLTDFFNTYGEGDFFGKYLVKNNGLNLVIAAFVGFSS